MPCARVIVISTARDGLICRIPFSTTSGRRTNPSSGRYTGGSCRGLPERRQSHVEVVMGQPVVLQFTSTYSFFAKCQDPMLSGCKTFPFILCNEQSVMFCVCLYIWRYWFLREYIIHNVISKEWKVTTYIRINWKKTVEQNLMRMELILCKLQHNNGK